MIMTNGFCIFDRFDEEIPETSELCDPLTLEKFGVLEKLATEKIESLPEGHKTLASVIDCYDEVLIPEGWDILWGHCRYKKRICQYTLHFSNDGGKTSAVTSFLLPFGHRDVDADIQYFLSLNPAIENGICAFGHDNPEATLKAVIAIQRLLSRGV